MVNSEALRARIREKGLRQQEIAEALGIARPTVSQKISNYRPFFLDEAVVLSKLLDIEMSEFSYYFFTEEGKCLKCRVITEPSR